jgi:hypothetical protein
MPIRLALFAAPVAICVWLAGSSGAHAQAADSSATAATASTVASTGTIGQGTKLVATYTATPPRLNAAQIAQMTVALARSNRSGPVNLPHAALQASGPVGPAIEIKPGIEAKAPASTAIFLTDRLVNPSGAQFSAVDEPSGDNQGLIRFQTGNWYAGKSSNRGATWTFVNPFTMFGSGFCCDQVVLYDPGRNVWFWLLQYTDGHLVLANSKDLVNWCSYSWFPSSFGTTGELDYNDLALSTNYINIVSNFFPSAGGSGSLVARLPIDPQVSCTGFSFNFFTRTDLGFTWKAVSGATDVLYWGTNWFGTLGSSFRIFKWAENSGTIFWFDRTLGTTFSFFTRNSGQNCASADGVVKNWCQFADSRVLGGARYSAPDGTAQLVFSFNAKQGGPFSLPFPYSERVHFRESDFAYLSSDRLWSNVVGWQFMSMASNARGHIGMTALYGGGTGTNHWFLSGAVFLNDDISPNQPWQVAWNASGSGNVCNAGGLWRTGDYTTTRPYRPTDLTFLGYNFVLTADAGSCGSTAPVAAHEAAFGRERDKRGAVNRWN